MHIYDADVSRYQDSAKAVNDRDDNSRAFITQKHEIESYLHSGAIKAAFDIEIEVTDHPKGGKATPKVFSEVISRVRRYDGVLSDNKAKQQLADKAFPKMTAEMINERDPDGEIKGWLTSIQELIK